MRARRHSSLPIFLFLFLFTWTIRAIPWPLGVLTTNSLTDPNCPAGFNCHGFTVSCPSVSNAIQGFWAIAPHQGAARGFVLFFTGGDGTSWWSTQVPELTALVDELRSLGFTVAQARWASSWLESSSGNDAGQAHLACRPATLIQFLHDRYYVPMGITNKQPGVAGFCISGNSGGSSQVGYALSHYGLDDILDVVVPSGGPPHSALAKSCMTNAGQECYWFDPGTLEFIDRGFGFFDNNGPAVRHDASFVPRWLQESVSTGGNDYFHPTTRVNFIIGENDPAMQCISSDYYNRLRTNGTPLLAYQIAPGTPHPVYSTDIGRAMIKAAILGLTLSSPVYTNHQAQFYVNGVTNTTINYIVQASTNLRDWIPLRTNAGSFKFTDTNAASYAAKFYRATSVP